MVRSLQDSPDGVAAVNADGSTSDKIGRSGRQKNGGSGAFVGIAPAAGWCPCNYFLVQRGIVFTGAVKSVSIHPGAIAFT
jgi:hypothetical protein